MPAWRGGRTHGHWKPKTCLPSMSWWQHHMVERHCVLWQGLSAESARDVGAAAPRGGGGIASGVLGDGGTHCAAHAGAAK